MVNDLIDSVDLNTSDEWNQKKSVNLIRHTETIDKLVVQNKTLQRELRELSIHAEQLQNKLYDSNVRISKNLFYIGLFALAYFVYSVNSNLIMLNDKLIEINVVVAQYKDITEKNKLYNQIMTEQNGINKTK